MIVQWDSLYSRKICRYLYVAMTVTGLFLAAYSLFCLWALVDSFSSVSDEIKKVNKGEPNGAWGAVLGLELSGARLIMSVVATFISLGGAQFLGLAETIAMHTVAQSRAGQSKQP